MSLSDYIPAKYIEMFSDPEFSKAIKGFNLYLLKEDPEYRAEVKIYFDECLLTSELKPVQRISTAETVLGLNDFSDFEEDHNPTIPEQIKELKEITSKINKEAPDFSDKSLVPPSKNLTEIRSDYLADYITTNSLIPKAPSIFANIEVRVIDSNEFRYFVDHILPPEYRPESNKNLRKLKKDVFETAVKRHKSKGIDTDKADHGRQELRLLYFREKTEEELQPLINAFNSQPSQTATV